MIIFAAMLDEPEDGVSFEDAYNRYRGKMFSLAYGITDSTQDAEDAVSSAFFAIARSFGKIKRLSGQERAAYYCAVTKNCAYDILRTRSRIKETPLDEENELSDEKCDVSDEVLSGIEYESVLGAIRSLPEKYARVLYLQNVTGLSMKEISEETGVSESTVRKQLERARAKLRAELEKQDITI